MTPHCSLTKRGRRRELEVFSGGVKGAAADKRKSERSRLISLSCPQRLDGDVARRGPGREEKTGREGRGQGSEEKDAVEGGGGGEVFGHVWWSEDGLDPTGKG